MTNNTLTAKDISRIIGWLFKSGFRIEGEKLVIYIATINADRERLEQEVERLETEMRTLT